jgi:hypothetical protein
MKKESAEGFILSLLFSLLVLFISGLFQTAAAQLESPGLAAPKLGNFIDIRVDNLPNETPAIAYNSQHNEFLVVWAEEVVPGRREIYGQRTGLDGALHGNAIRIAYDSSVDCWSPAVAYSPTHDKYLVVFTQKITSNVDFDIRAKFVSWDGGSINEIIIDTSSNTRHWYPAVSYNQQSDEFLVIYEYYKTGTDGREIIAQRRKASDGSQLGVTSTIAGGTGEVRRIAKVAHNSTRNEYLLAYTYAANTTTIVNRIRMKRLSADLSSVLTNETELTTVDYADGVSLAAGPDEYLAVWNEGASPSDTQKIWGRRINGNGTLGPFIKIADHAPQSCIEPAVAFGPILGYSLSWRCNNAGNFWEVFGRFLKGGENTPSGNEFGFIDNVSLIRQQRSPAVACGASGTCLAVMEDIQCCDFLSDYDIRGRLILPNLIHLPLIKR